VSSWSDFDVTAAEDPTRSKSGARSVYKTKLGTAFWGDSIDWLRGSISRRRRRKAQLVFTSPPFLLNAQKSYGNHLGQTYIDWVAQFGPLLRDAVTEDGSIVVELGNAWEPGRPVMSTGPLQALLELLRAGDLNLCQEFIWYNPARLPSPAQWTNLERSRIKDAFTRIWWMSPSDRPKADNTRVLREYSASMKRLIESGKYNAGKRPNEARVGRESFKTNNSGSIPPSVLGGDDVPALGTLLKTANTTSNSQYLLFCRDKDIQPHPARMPESVAEFFIRFLTDEGDLVLDPFAGSNTTGAEAEKLNRQWLSCDMDWSYLVSSLGRFAPEAVASATSDLSIQRRADRATARPVASLRQSEV